MPSGWLIISWYYSSRDVFSMPTFIAYAVLAGIKIHFRDVFPGSKTVKFLRTFRIFRLLREDSKHFFLKVFYEIGGMPGHGIQQMKTKRPELLKNKNLCNPLN